MPSKERPVWSVGKGHEHIPRGERGVSMADDYIRKTDAVNAVPKERIVEYMDEFGAGYNSCRNDMLRSIESLEPAGVVPVVRCKDCLFFTTEKSCCRPEGLIKAREDAFCSYGERREW